ncbi:MAG: hypothetical protein HW391_250 [Chloroflexi bacterium]|nr:hypothetical protein [Chloroflexota bacterium]
MAIFAVGIGISSFLLFWLQPLIGQVVLPLYGGTPAVWATVLVFFQGTLLLGYLYGHASVTRLPARTSLVVHVVLAVLAAVWLVLQPLEADRAAPGDLPAALDVLRILAIRVGPPVFVLTATTPLLSAWFAARRGESEKGDPYGLYALSNAASLGALVAYPFLIGPLVGLTRQLALWSIGFGALGLVLALAAAMVWRTRAIGDRIVRGPTGGSAGAPAADSAGAPAADPNADELSGPPTPRITWPRRLRWLLLAAVPSGLLAAVTNFIAVDLIAAPLLWIVPLGLYLGSFIVAFSERGRRLVPWAVRLAPALITLLWVPIGSVGGWPLVPLVVLEWSGLAIIATALHGRLALDRPPAARLTEFYLVQSVGGVVGGAFVAIVAPSVFPGVWEYPILLAGALAALALTSGARAGRGPVRTLPPEPATTPSKPSTRSPRLDFGPIFGGWVGRLAPFGLVAGLLIAFMAVDQSVALGVALRWFGFGALILFFGGQPWFLAIARPALLRDRSFFGVTEVIRSPDAGVTVLMNGTTVHGMQSTDPAFSRRPTTYYARSGPLGDVFGWLEAARPSGSIAVVGLGAGTIAAYQQPGQALTFFEIDPLVVRVASDPRYFTYMSGAPSAPAIVLGDARLSLRDVPADTFDLLILDAFSSDAIPTHLLTLEALADDLRVLRAGGVIAVHVSNRFYDLAPALGASGERLGLRVLDRGYSPTPAEAEAGAAISYWVVLTRDAAVADAFAGEGWVAAQRSAVEPLTDDHPDILRFLTIGR